MSKLKQLAMGLAMVVGSIIFMVFTEDMPGHPIRWAGVVALVAGFAVAIAADLRKST